MFCSRRFHNVLRKFLYRMRAMGKMFRALKFVCNTYKEELKIASMQDDIKRKF